MKKLKSISRVTKNLLSANYRKIKLIHLFHKINFKFKSKKLSAALSKIKTLELTVYQHLISNYHKKSILLFSHDLSRSGAPMALLSIVKILYHQYHLNVILVTLSSGELGNEFSKFCRVICLHQFNLGYIEEPTVLDIFFKILRSYSVQKAILNTLCGGLLIPCLESNQFQYVILNHELPGSIKAFGWDQTIIPHLKIISEKNKLIFSTHYSYDEFVKHFSSLTQKYVLPQGCEFTDKNIDKKIAFDELTRKLDLPKNAKIILGAGKGFERKGIDFFYEIATRMTRENPDLYFIWLGNVNEPEIVNLLYKNVASKNIIFKSFESIYITYMAAAKIFLLPSREDTLPNVALEALACGTPVLAFKNCGGIQEWLNQINPNLIVKQYDLSDFINKIKWLLNDAHDYNEISNQASILIKNNFNYETYVSTLLNLINIDEKHSLFLDLKLGFIDRPKYKLSDCSSKLIQIFNSIA